MNPPSLDQLPASTHTKPDVALWPKKSRKLQDWAQDSTRWNDFAFRDDDVIIATYPKSGTTWMQQIVGQLIFEGDDVAIREISPWVDLRAFPKEDVTAMLKGQSHRRFVKTHLPLDALAFSSRAKYIYVVRDPRDVVWSWYNFHANFTPLAYEIYNGLPGRVGPAIEPLGMDVRSYYHAWLDRDGFPNPAYWPHVQSWWDYRALPNILLVHFDSLKADLETEVRRVAQFLEIETNPGHLPNILEHCSFAWMKANADKVVGPDEHIIQGGGSEFMHKGTNGRWRDVLSLEEIAKCDDLADLHLSADCVRWLRTGIVPNLHATSGS
jgi:aryl sulfotransferase